MSLLYLYTQSFQGEWRGQALSTMTQAEPNNVSSFLEKKMTATIVFVLNKKIFFFFFC